MDLSVIQQAWYVAASNVMTMMIAFLPRLLWSLLVLVIGFLLGKYAKRLVIGILKSVHLSQVIKNSAIEKFMEQADIGTKIEEVLGEAIRWLIIVVFFIASMNILGLTPVSMFLQSVLAYLPTVISAALIFTVGVLLAGFVESMVKGAVSSVDVKTGRLAGKVSSYTVVIFTALVAISELGIAQSFINILFTGLVATFAIAIGLAFGLGSKDIVQKLLTEWYEGFAKDTKKK